MTENRPEYGLKPCPFCGRQFIIQTFSENMIFVRHNVIGGCPLTGGIAFSETAEDVVEWLNTRPIEDALNAQIADLTARNKHLEWDLEQAERRGDDLARRNIDLQSEIDNLQKALNEKNMDLL